MVLLVGWCCVVRGEATKGTGQMTTQQNNLMTAIIATTPEPPQPHTRKPHARAHPPVDHRKRLPVVQVRDPPRALQRQLHAPAGGRRHFGAEEVRE